MRTLEVTPRRTIAIQVRNGIVRCPFQRRRPKVTIADCAACPRRKRFVNDFRGQAWVHCVV